MPNNTCTSAQMQCTFGAAPSVFNPTPKKVNTNYKVAANIMDNVGGQNIPPFGMCSSMSNPAVAAATAAASGVLTPQACTPQFPAPWTPGSVKVILCGQPALNNTSKLTCAFAGVVSFTNPGQTTHNIP